MKISPETAIELLSSGHVVALPTETVYGLAAALSHPEAIHKIYSLKGRPSNNPLIVHLATPDQLLPYVTTLPPKTDALIEHFWPGPLSIVLPARNIPPEATGGLTTAAFRIPDFPLTRQIIEKTGPLVMPSANLSGKPSGTSLADLTEDFGVELPMVDGGKRPGGIESTVIHYTEGRWHMIRRGAISAEQLAVVLEEEPPFLKTTSEKPTCPGQLYRHYAPRAKLKLVCNFENEAKGFSGAILGFSDRTYPAELKVISLGPLSDPYVVAQNLYDSLRECDRQHLQEVWVDFDIPEGGLWETLRERLTKAASGD